MPATAISCPDSHGNAPLDRSASVSSERIRRDIGPESANMPQASDLSTSCTSSPGRICDSIHWKSGPERAMADPVKYRSPAIRQMVISVSNRPLGVSRWFRLICPSVRGMRFAERRSSTAPASCPVISNWAKGREINDAGGGACSPGLAPGVFMPGLAAPADLLPLADLAEIAWAFPARDFAKDRPLGRPVAHRADACVTGAGFRAASRGRECHAAA